MLLGTVVALCFVQGILCNNGFLSFELAKTNKGGVPNLAQNVLCLGQKPVTNNIINRLTYYSLNITVGTPPQSFEVQVDTGSSDLWLADHNIKFDGFNKAYSSTFKSSRETFSIDYIKNYARGTWAEDVVRLPGYESSEPMRLEFGLAYHAPDSSAGILGLGPVESESRESKYPNFPQQLKDQGLIDRAAYSIYFDDTAAKSGHIIFGGIDRAKHTGLKTVPMLTTSSFVIALSGVLIGEDEQLLKQRTPVLLDTGCSLTYLPDELVAAIAASYGARWNPSLGMYVMHRRNRSSLSKLSMQFGRKQSQESDNVTVTMPIDDLLWPLSWFTLEYSDFDVLTILPNSQSMGLNILGLNFLRAAYTVYDLEGNVILIGQRQDSGFSDTIAI